MIPKNILLLIRGLESNTSSDWLNETSNQKFCYFQIQNCFKPLPNKPWFSRVCSTSLLKTQRKKEKFLVTSNFSFSHNVFYTLENFLPFAFSSKLPSANSLSLEKSKICGFGMG